MENKYQKGQIYKIVDVGYNKCYIGSTIETLSNRMAKHRNHYKDYVNKTGKVRTKSFDLFDEFGVENCKIVWVKDYPCNSRKELEAEEGRIQQETDCVNKNLSGRTNEQYRKDHSDYLQTYFETYRRENKEKIKQRDKQYRDNNKDKIQQYKQNNREKEKLYNTRYYEKNKDIINARKKTN